MATLAPRLNELAVPETLRRHWRAWAVLGLMAALWLAAAISVGIRSVSPPPELDRAAPSAPVLASLRAQAEATSATALRQVNPLTAVALNAAIPIADLANPPATPFHLAGGAADRARSLDCLTAAIYYEAATEPTDGQRGVAQVVLNRVRHPAYPHSRLRRRLRRRAPADRLPVQLRLRRLAAPRAGRILLAARPGGRGRGAQRLCLCAGRLVDPLSCQLCDALLGADPGQIGQCRPAHLLPLARRLGAPGRLQQQLWRGRAGDRLARRLRPADRRRRPDREQPRRGCRPGRRRGARERQRQRRQLPARGAAPLRADAAGQRERGDRRTCARRRSQYDQQQSLGADRDRQRPGGASPARPRQSGRSAPPAPGRPLPLGSDPARAARGQ